MDAPREILVATDFSPIGNHAVGYAIEVAKALNASVHILHVCEPVADVDIPLEVDTIDQVERGARRQLDQLRHSLSAAGVAITCDVEVGASAHEILRSASRMKSDLIVMGTHGRRGLRRALLGSVAEAVARSAPCPVLVVRPTDSEPR